jgi:hypothetical protein
MKNWNAEKWIGIALAGVAAAALPACGQTAAGMEHSTGILVSPAGPVPVPASISGEIVREIDDPHTGIRWLLMRDLSHPGGPGRLVPAANPRSEARPNEPVAEPVRPVIRAGDRLVVEEDTAVVSSRLEAVALGPAAVGSSFDARLKIGGRVVRVLALATGRAAFKPEGEARQ